MNESNINQSKTVQAATNYTRSIHSKHSICYIHHQESKSRRITMLSPKRSFLWLLWGFHSTRASFAFDPSIGWSWYKHMLTQKPLITKSMTSCATNAFSDILCQKLMQNSDEKEVEEKKKLDEERLLHASVTGLIWSGPVTHFWYKILFGNLVTFKNPTLALLGQIFLDAIVFSPVTVSGYFALRSILEGSGWKGVREKLSTRLFTTVLGAWKFWPAANLVNFSIVPMEFRVLYMNVLSVFWSGYLTYVNSQKIGDTKSK